VAGSLDGIDGIFGIVTLVGVIVGAVYLSNRVSRLVRVDGFALRSMIQSLQRLYVLVAAISSWMTLMALWGFLRGTQQHGFPTGVTTFTAGWWAFGVIVVRYLATKGTPLQFGGRGRWTGNLFLGTAFLAITVLWATGNGAVAAGLALFIVLPAYLLILLLARRATRANETQQRAPTGTDRD